MFDDALGRGGACARMVPVGRAQARADRPRRPDEEEAIHGATLRQWQEAAASALADAGKPRGKKKSPEAKRVAELERELRRKEKALAEMAALITLQEKVQAIWGDEGDGTSTKSET